MLWSWRRPNSWPVALAVPEVTAPAGPYAWESKRELLKQGDLQASYHICVVKVEQSQMAKLIINQLPSADKLLGRCCILRFQIQATKLSYLPRVFEHSLQDEARSHCSLTLSKDILLCNMLLFLIRILLRWKPHCQLVCVGGDLCTNHYIDRFYTIQQSWEWVPREVPR